mmetsp:Transcript_29840/g.41220  ORF Transcript_29840/g.41220 Transcript_29840/m.41220 type:complete len:347 (-) Transcript_29840:113-1153(-)
MSIETKDIREGLSEQWKSVLSSVSSWQLTLQAKPSGGSVDVQAPHHVLRVQSSSSDAQVNDQAISLHFRSPSPLATTITSPFDYSLSLCLRENVISVPLERRRREGSDIMWETVWITPLLERICVPVSSRIKFHFDVASQVGQFRILSAHITLHALLILPVLGNKWAPPKPPKEEVESKMSVYGGYTVFFTLRKKDGYELKKTLTNQRITHAKSHVSNTVMINCRSDFNEYAMNHIVTSKIATQFEFIGDITVIGRNGSIVWFHSGYLWIKERIPNEFVASFLCSSASEESTISFSMLPIKRQELQLTWIMNLSIIFPLSKINYSQNLKFAEVAYRLVERGGDDII